MVDINLTSMESILTSWIILLLLLPYYCVLTHAQELTQIIRIADKSPIQGQYKKGENGKLTTEFLGIPFAEPPVGSNRFRRPIPKKAWKETLVATKLPNACIQTPDNAFGDFTGATMWNANTKKSEDCLYLNVWIPGKIDPSKRTQVMIWVYGGGFWSGCSTLAVYDGKILASEENIIIVRLWDQLEAFKWVKKNIQYFGGNPDDVTIFGESAGAASDINPDRNKVMDCLRKVSAETLRETEWITHEFLDFPWTPVVDGEFFTEDPRHSMERGDFKKTELVVGTNFDESMFFIVYDMADVMPKKDLFSKTDFITTDFLYYENAARLLPGKYRLNPAVREAILFEYKDWELPGSAHRRQQALDKMFGDYHFTCSVNEFAQLYAKAGGSVYYYYFMHIASAQTWPKWMGVLHGYEINFIFGEPLNTLNYTYTREEKELSRKFMKYWANFARTGNPNINWDNSYMMDVWPQFTLNGEEYITMTVNHSAIGYGPRRRQCAFWKNYIPKLVTATTSLTELEFRWKEEFKKWETEYIQDWQYHFNNYKRYQNYRRQDQCPNDEL